MIKASGRVMPKRIQNAKPGEGGQLPGPKVNPLIAQQEIQRRL